MLRKLILSAFTLVGLMTVVQAQFDDAYYDPQDNQNSYDRSINTDYANTKEDQEPISYDEKDFDDEYADIEDQDYYYASRIKRFHRPYNGFDYYDPCFVNPYYYDPYRYDPWLFDRDIYYSYNTGYSDYWRWRRWSRYNNWDAYSYWNHFDWYWGFSPYTVSYRYYYNPYYYNNHCGFGWSFYNDWYSPHYGGYYGNHHYNSNDNWDHNRNPKGSYYGSRRNGFYSGSGSGPVRVSGPEFNPRKATGGGVSPDNGRSTPRKIISVDGGREVNPSNTGSEDRSGSRVSPRVNEKYRNSEPSQIDPHRESGDSPSSGQSPRRKMESDNSSPSTRPNGSNNERGISPSDRSTPRKFQSGSVEQNNNDYMDNRSFQQEKPGRFERKERPNERSNNNDQFKEKRDRDGSINEGRNSSRGSFNFLKESSRSSSFGDSDRGSSRSSGNSSSSGRSSGNSSSSSNGNSSGRKSPR